MQKIILFLSLFIVLFTAPSYANIKVMGLKLAAETCDSLAGIWEGSGVVSNAFLSCEYSGTVTVVANDKPDSYAVVADLQLDSGICPQDFQLKMTGSCLENQLTMANDDTNLSGSLDPSGRLATLSGDVYFSVLGTRLKANLEDVRLKKQA